MDRREELSAGMGHASGDVLQVLTHLHNLSRHLASSSLAQVQDLAVDLPIRCFRADMTALLLPSASGNLPTLAAHRNLPPLLYHYLGNPSDDDGIICWVAETSSPKVIDTVPNALVPVTSPYAIGGVRSIAAVPVEVPRQQPGALLCMSSDHRPFRYWEVQALHTIANQVAAALAHTNGDNAGDVAPRETAVESLVHPADTRDLGSLLDQALAGALASVDADSGSIMLCKNRKLVITASKGLRNVARTGGSADQGMGVAGWVAANGKPLLLNGPADSCRYPLLSPRPEISSSIVVPVKGRRQLLGVLSVNSQRPDHVFGRREQMLLANVSNYIGMAVENAALYEAARTQTRFLAGLYKIARTITSSLELGNVIDMVLERLHVALSADIACLILYDRESGRTSLTRGYGLGEAPDQEYVDLVMPLVHATHGLRKAVAVPEMLTHTDYGELDRARLHGARSAAVAPLRIKKRTVGYVAAFRRQPNGFPGTQPILLSGLAQLAAIAIENARLYAYQSDIAHITQKELSPHALEAVPGFDIGSRYTPAHQIGGDYYDILKLSEHEFGLVISDVAGRNITAGKHIAMCKHSLMALATETRSPSELLRKINRLIYENTEPEAFISMFYGILDAGTRRLRFSSAGHEPMLVYRPQTGRTEFVATPGLLLGIQPAVDYAEDETDLQSGDICMLYTDGLVDCISHRYSTALEKITRTLLADHLKPAQEIADNIHGLVSRRGARSADDVAILLLKHM